MGKYRFLFLSYFVRKTVKSDENCKIVKNFLKKCVKKYRKSYEFLEKRSILEVLMKYL